MDLPSRRALEEAVADFEGTIIFASHDRYFIDRIATKCLYFETAEFRFLKATILHLGKAAKLKTCLLKKTLNARQPLGPSKSEVGGAITLDSPKETGNSTDLDAEIECIESEITKLEEREQELASALANPDTYLATGRDTG